jgi:mono/diheme cytochrome c family protein
MLDPSPHGRIRRRPVNYMIRAVQTGLVIVAALAVGVIGATLFIESGYYNIGADDHHTKLVLALIGELRERSIGARADTLDLRYVEDPENIAAGAQHYAALCVGCHLAPGVTKSEIRPGLYPHPPNLAQEDLHGGRRAFWIIKHGIKMSAMPAWSKALDDEAIWDIVSFVRKMPDMTPETYQRLSRKNYGRIEPPGGWRVERSRGSLPNSSGLKHQPP